MQNTWNTEPKIWEGQTIDRIPVWAYLDENTEVAVHAIIVNGFLTDMDLNGYKRSDFQDLETDTREALALHGFKLAGKDCIEIDYNF